MIRKAYVETPDGQIHYRVKEGSGTPIVCFHQTASSSAMFERFMAAYPGPEPVYALDTPGFGGSFDPKGATQHGRLWCHACGGNGWT